MKKRTGPTFPQEGLRFLRSLKRNNNREWFQEHKTIYENCVKQPMTGIIEAMATDFERFAPEMIASPKVSAYRIYRDTRFSKNKAPYKTHVAAVFPRSSLGKHEGAGFYFQISPGEVLIGGGLYMPLPEDLHQIRTHIAENSKTFFAILKNTKFRNFFGDITGERLSRIPKGFPADHPAADYLKCKQFLAGRTFPGSVAVRSEFYQLIVETFRAILPLVRFLNEPIIRARRTRDRQRAMMVF